MSTSQEIQMIGLHLILAVPDCQARVAESEEAIEEYTERLQNGSEAPPIVLFFDSERYWVGDGHHRVKTYQRVGRKEIPAFVLEGGRRDARLYACQANSGVRRSNADKRNAVKILLKDHEWGLWSDSEIARRAGVSITSVGRYRAQLGLNQQERKTARGVRTFTARTPKDPEAFDLNSSVRGLQARLSEEFARWPEEKQHCFCVLLRNFTSDNDPEIRERVDDELDKFYKAERRKMMKGAR